MTEKKPTSKKKATKKKAAPKPVPQHPLVAQLGDNITIGVWKGIPNYECAHCAYATPTPERAWEHYLDVHLKLKEKPTRATIDTGLVTGSGEPIMRETEPAEED